MKKWVWIGFFFLFTGCGYSTSFVNKNSLYALENHTRIENALLAEVNRQRNLNGISSLKMKKELREVALRYSIDMGEKEYFSHIDPNSRDIRDRLLSSGVNFASAAENLALVIEGNVEPIEVVNAWFKSEKHQKNLLDDSFSETGIGVFRNHQGYFYITQIFMRPVSGQNWETMTDKIGEFLIRSPKEEYEMFVLQQIDNAEKFGETDKLDLYQEALVFGLQMLEETS